MSASPSSRTTTRSQPVVNVILGLLSYMPVAAVIPLALLLLARTGQRPSDLGLTSARWRDVGVAVGLAAAGLGCEFLLAIPFSRLKHSALVNTAGPLHVPVYYLIFGLSQALITAIAEETAVSGYLLTRLDQLGWSPWRAFWLSLALRTSYHAYYGLGIVAHGATRVLPDQVLPEARQAEPADPGSFPVRLSDLRDRDPGALAGADTEPRPSSSGDARVARRAAGIARQPATSPGNAGERLEHDPVRQVCGHLGVIERRGNLDDVEAGQRAAPWRSGGQRPAAGGR